MVPLWMFPLAVACGNTFILKPSEKVPSTSLRLAELFHEAGLPAGVLNVVQSDLSTADKLMQCPEISAVSFVGSTPAATAIYSVLSTSGKPFQALGGAKNHAIVLPRCRSGNDLRCHRGRGFWVLRATLHGIIGSRYCRTRNL